MADPTSRTSELKLKWLYLAWLSVAVAIVGIGLIGAIVQGDPGPFIKDRLGFSDIGLFALVLHTIGMGLAVYLLGKHLKRNKLKWEVVGLRGSLTMGAALVAVLAAVFAFFLFPVVEALVKSLGVSMYWGGADNLLLDSKREILFALIFPALTAPVLEEIVFRGYVLTALRNRFKLVAAILVASLIFTSTHVFFGPGLMLYIFLWSFLPTLLYLRYRTLYPAILFHILNNVTAYVVLPLLDI